VIIAITICCILTLTSTLYKEEVEGRDGKQYYEFVCLFNIWPQTLNKYVLIMIINLHTMFHKKPQNTFIL
jgi:hypothetical protein